MRKHETAWHDTDDLVVGSVQQQAAPDDVLRAGKLPLPQIVADEHDPRAIETIFRW
jgi:hypothetical protein